MSSRLRAIGTSRIFLAAVATLLLYALAGFVLAPYLVERYAPGYAETLGAKASIGGVRINPFLLRLEAREVRLEHPPGRQLAAVERLSVDLQLSSLFRRAWTFADIQIDGLDVALEIERDGALNLAALVDRVRKRHDAVVAGEARRRWLVQHLALRDGKLTFTDLSGRTPTSTRLAPIDLTVRELTTLPERRGQYDIAAELPGGGSIGWRGDVSLLPLASTGALEVKGMQVGAAWGFIRDAVRVSAPSGSLDLAASYRFAYADGKPALGLEGARARVSGLVVRDGRGEPVLAFDTIAASDARLDLGRREIVLPRLELRDGRVAAAVAADGSIDLATLLAPAQSPASGERVRPWKYTLETVAAQHVHVALVDRRDEQPVAYGVDVASATVHAVGNHGDSPMRFESALTIAPGGAVRAIGTIARDLATAEAQVEATDIPLSPARPLLARYATLDLKSGRVSVSARMNYRGSRKGSEPLFVATGAIRVDDVLINEDRTGERFVSWKTLSAEDASLTLAPHRLSIKEIRLEEPGAKVLISKDREVNLTQVLKPGAGRRDQPAFARNGPAADGRFTANVGRVRVRNGTVDFADLSLPLPFSAKVRRLNGTAVGLSTDRASRAELKFDGRIQGSGAAKLEGGLNAFSPRAFTDVRVEFDNVEMPHLSPYAASFAGRKIASGRLWLDLRYKVVDGRLTADNRIVMQDFTLGERVESANALDLPLDLAVALLTDSQGRINVAVPVTGDVDNPQFSYRRLIREALAGLIVRVASAPFRALAGLFGGGTEALGTVQFEPGRARLLPPEREKLDKVAQALQEKPQLKLVVHGPYDPRLDGEALRERQVR
ncbi:MAG: DUF748 domain-containing protein, partial [Burkholderiales bacterium]